MTLLGLIVVFTVLCAGVEVLAHRAPLSPEILRKLAHMSSAVLAAFLPLVATYPEIAALGLVFAAVMAVSIRFHVFSAIHDVSRETYGEVFFPLGIAALALAFPSPAPFAFGVLVLGLGDGLAALVGGRYGRRVVPLFETRKTLWGSGTFLATTFVLGVVLLAPSGASLAYALVAAAAMAIVLTPAELLLTRGFDNLVLPAMAGSLLAGL